jgi:hypothetical protein
MKKQTSPSPSATRGRKTKSIRIVDYHGDAPEEFPAYALEQICAHYKDELDEVSIVDGVEFLIRDMLYLLADHDCEIEKLEDGHRAKCYPRRLSNYDAAITQLQDALDDRSKGNVGYLGNDR